MSFVSFIVVRVSFVPFICCLCDIDNLWEFGKACEELYGKDQDLRTPTLIRSNLERGEEREALREESDGSQQQNYASKLSRNRCTSTQHRTVQELPPRLLPKIILKKPRQPRHQVPPHADKKIMTSNTGKPAADFIFGKIDVTCQQAAEEKFIVKHGETRSRDEFDTQKKKSFECMLRGAG